MPHTLVAYHHYPAARIHRHFLIFLVAVEEDQNGLKAVPARMGPQGKTNYPPRHLQKLEEAAHLLTCAQTKSRPGSAQLDQTLGVHKELQELPLSFPVKLVHVIRGLVAVGISSLGAGKILTGM